MTLASLVLAVGAAAAPAPSPAPASAPAAAADERPSLGWTPDGGEPAACDVVQPKLDAKTAAWLSVNQPAGLPQPTLRCGQGEIELPVSRDPALLQRVETGKGGGPIPVEWSVRAAGSIRGPAAVASLDFPPYVEHDRGTAPTLTLPSELGHPLALVPRPVRDPSSFGRGSKYNRVPEPPRQDVLPILQVEDVTGGVAEDSLVATVGGKWLAFTLGGEQPRLRFKLDEGRVFGGNARLFVAPRPLQLDAATTIFAVDPATLAVTDLGRPAPEDAGKWLRVTDVRDRDGVVEALVCVDLLSQEGLTSPYGLLAVRKGGAWSFPERYFTPTPAQGRLPELRFDDADPTRVRLVSAAGSAWAPLHRAAASAPR